MLPAFEIGIVARSVIGLGAASLWVSDFKVSSSWFKPSERELVTGIYGASGTTGAIIALLGVPLLSVALGWRYLFLLSAVPIFFLAVIDWFTIKDKPKDAELSPTQELKFMEFEVPGLPL